jgi:outer membrane protein TolC
VPEISYPLLEKLIQTAKSNYPRVKAFDKRIDIAKTNVQKAKLSWFEVVNTSYTYNPGNYISIVNPNFFIGYQFSVNLNIGTLLQKPSVIKNAKNELEISRLDRQEYDLNLEALVKERYFTYLQYITLLKLATHSASDADNTLNAIKHKFDRGEETFENYSKAVIDHSNLLQEKIKSETALFIAKSNLEELLGKKLEEVK